MDLYSGDKRIGGDITFDSVLVDALRKYPDRDRLIFGAKTKNQPSPINVKKLLLALIAANILTYSATIKPIESDGDENNSNCSANSQSTTKKDDTDKKTTVILKATLGKSRYSTTGRSRLAIEEDYYWNCIRQRPPVIIT